MSKKDPNSCQKDFSLDILQNLLKIYFKSYFGNNLKGKLVLLLLFHDQSHIASNCFLRHFKCVWPSMSKLPKITSLLFLCNILKQNVSDEIYFLHAGKHQSLLQIDNMISMGQEWSRIPKVSKIASLQCLCNISKKELEMKLIFCM